MTCTFIRQPPFHINHYGQFQRWLSYTGFTVFWCWPLSLFYKKGVWTGCVCGPFRSSRINFVINNFIWYQKRLFWITCSQLAQGQIKVSTVCLNYRKFRGKWNSLKSPFRTSFLCLHSETFNPPVLSVLWSYPEIISDFILYSNSTIVIFLFHRPELCLHTQ